MDKNKNKNEEIKKKHEQQEAIKAENISEEKTKKIEELEQKVKEFEDKWKRVLADYQNQEKWVREQRSEWTRSANKDLLLRILPVLDTLILAQDHNQGQAFKVSIDQFIGVLKDEGVLRIETVGKEFDPYLMEVITTIDGEENKVIKEIRAGYMIYDKILRPAQVAVGNGNKVEN